MLVSVDKVTVSYPGKIMPSGTTDIPRCFWCGTAWGNHDTGSQCPFRC